MVRGRAFSAVLVRTPSVMWGALVVPVSRVGVCVSARLRFHVSVRAEFLLTHK